MITEERREEILKEADSCKLEDAQQINRERLFAVIRVWIDHNPYKQKFTYAELVQLLIDFFLTGYCGGKEIIMDGIKDIFSEQGYLLYQTEKGAFFERKPLAAVKPFARNKDKSFRKKTSLKK